MGTRNLTVVVSDGEYRVAQYCQWDGYPGGQGINILNFLSSSDRIDLLRENVKKCSFITEEQYDKLHETYRETHQESVHIAENGRHILLKSTINDFLNDYPQFSRDTGSDILRMIAASPDGLTLYDDHEFAADSLFCEWAYVIDLDQNTFEVYSGFNTTPLQPSERFYSLQTTEIDTGEERYYPVHMIRSYSLSDLPDQKTFLEECEGE